MYDHYFQRTFLESAGPIKAKLYINHILPVLGRKPCKGFYHIWGFSVMFHFMFVHYTFSSVLVAEWPSFGK